MTKLILLSTRWSINLALAVVLGYSIVQLLTPHPPLEKNIQYNHSVVNTPHSTKTLNISSLLNAHLFGNSNVIGTKMVKIPHETKLNLKLHGIYYSSNPMKSFAMIAADKGKSISYHIDQSLPSGALLYEIYPQKVILLRNGRHETLHLVDKKNVRTSKKNSSSMNISANILTHYQRQLQTNPESFMQLVRISPVHRGKKLLGYRLQRGKDASLLSRFNLQSGDILTAVNGVKLDSPLKGLSIVQQLATAKKIDLQILRNGQVVPLSFRLQE